MDRGNPYSKYRKTYLISLKRCCVDAQIERNIDKVFAVRPTSDETSFQKKSQL